MDYCELGQGLCEPRGHPAKDPACVYAGVELCFVDGVADANDLTPLEQLSLVADLLRHRPVSHINVRPLGVNSYMRYTESGMPLLPKSIFQVDWTAGLPDELRVALRAITAARLHRSALPREAVQTVEAWLAVQRKGPLGAEAKALRAKYLAKTRATEPRRKSG